MGGTRRFLAALSAGLFLSACGPATAGPPATPTPTPKTLDLHLWTVSSVGSGPAATDAANGVDLFIPGNATEDPEKHLISINLAANCKLTADFDLQLDYSLTTWPAKNGVRFGLAAGSYVVARTSNPAYTDNRYVTDFAGPTTSVETRDMRGRLRLTRTGATITGYYMSNGGWVKIASTAGSTDQVPYAIAAWTDPLNFGKTDVRVNLANFDLAPRGTGCTG